MAEIRLLWLPKCISAAGATLKSGAAERITTAKSGVGTERSTIIDQEKSGSKEQYSCWPSSCSGGVRKVLKKLKKQGRKLRWYGGGRRQCSIQCRYDPLSYSLNFDTNGRGNLADDDLDYYRFSSRFVVANPSNSSLTS